MLGHLVWGPEHLLWVQTEPWLNSASGTYKLRDTGRHLNFSESLVSLLENGHGTANLDGLQED